MAESLPEGTRLTHSARKIDIAGKTPAGVWVIVGIALVFVIGGLGAGAFMAWKSIAGKMRRLRRRMRPEAGRLKAGTERSLCLQRGSRGGTSEANDRSRQSAPGGRLPIRPSKTRSARKY